MKSFVQTLFITFISLISLGAFSQGNSEGIIKNRNGKAIVSLITNTGVTRDINNDTIYSVNPANGEIRDINGHYIGKIINNQILDGGNGILYTLTNDDRILDINSHQVGSIDTDTKQVKDMMGTVLGNFEDMDAIQAVYYYFVYNFQ